MQEEERPLHGPRLRRPLLSPARIAAVYMVLAALWIIFSDRMLHAVFPDAQALAQAQTVKGLAFITITGLAIWALSRHMARQMEAIRRAQMAALAEREERFRAAFEQAAVGMALVTPDGAFRRVNDRYGELAGRTAEELASLSWADIVHPDDLPPLLDAAAAVAAGSRPHAHVEVRYLLPDGSPVWGRTTLSPVRQNNRVRLIAALCEDITIRKRMEQDLVHTVEELTRSNTELERFAHLASHDLKEPTRTQVSFAQLLERHLGDRLDGDGRVYLAHLVTGARRMRQIVDDLMLYASADTRQEPFRTVDLGRALAVALESLHASIESENAVVAVDGSLPTVSGLDAQIVQLLRALVGNALKFRHPDRPPRITVTAEPDGEMWRVTITDNGLGFDQERAEEAFQMFRRLHGPGVTPGSGIGLSLARRIVERHGGHISLTTRRDAGTTVSFTLPMVTSQSDARAAQ